MHRGDFKKSFGLQVAGDGSSCSLMSFHEVIAMSVNRFAETLASLFNGVSGRGRIQRLCAELEWSVDEEDGDYITLYFKDDLVGRRDVFIHDGDQSLITFAVYSHLIQPATQVPEQLAAYLLKRNSELGISKWGAVVDKDGDLVLSVRYYALGDSMTANVLKFISSSLLSEANDFDTKMRKAGLLRL